MDGYFPTALYVHNTVHFWHPPAAVPGHDYILESQTLTFMYDESNNISSTPCANVTIQDDFVPENDLNVTIGLSVALNDSKDVFLTPGKNQSTILILDDDHGM